VAIDAEEIARIEQMVSVIPVLCYAIRNINHLNLIQKVDKILSRAEVRNATLVPLNHRVRRDFLLLCKEIASSLKSVEASIFLEDLDDGSDVFRFTATPRRGRVTESNYYRLKKDNYFQELGNELAHWLSADASPIQLFEPGQPASNGEKPGYANLDSTRIGSSNIVKEGDILKSNGNGESPVFGVMAVPIAAGGKLLGCIQCHMVRKNSAHSVRRDLDLLQSVATHISHYWANWLKRCEAHQENLSWRKLLQGFNELDALALDVLTDEAKDAERLICAKALRVVASVVRGADILDVRLMNQGSEKLDLFETYGEAWSQGTAGEINARKQHTFPVDGSAPTPVGSEVLQQGKTCLMTGSSIEPYYSEQFPETKRMIIAPIFIQGKCHGLLDICGTGNSPFPAHATMVAEMICQRLGSYKYLAETSKQKRQTDMKLADLIQIHSQFHEDLAHQLKSPILQALRRVKTVLKSESLDKKLKRKLQPVRGLCGKASKVTMSTNLFAALARGETFKPNLSNLWYDDLTKMLVEAATDSQLMADPEHHITFRLNREEMLESLPMNKVLAKVDDDLLQQAINNLLDNAGKYSYENTVVRISASFNTNGRFFISVVNEGLPIRAEDVPYCIQRHWRGDKASLTTGEGSGIGLWIVNHIMEAHGGKLVIIPTTSNNLTDVRLVFP
jgi:hypothetical protein